MKNKKAFRTGKVLLACLGVGLVTGMGIVIGMDRMINQIFVDEDWKEDDWNIDDLSEDELAM